MRAAGQDADRQPIRIQTVVEGSCISQFLPFLGPKTSPAAAFSGPARAAGTDRRDLAAAGQ